MVRDADDLSDHGGLGRRDDYCEPVGQGPQSACGDSSIRCPADHATASCSGGCVIVEKELLFTQKGDLASKPGGGLAFPEDTTEGTKCAWERRSRVKQAAILSLGMIGSLSED